MINRRVCAAYLTSHYLTTSASTSTSCFLYLANHWVPHSEDTDRSSSAIVSIVYQLSNRRIMHQPGTTKMIVLWQCSGSMHAIHYWILILYVTEAVACMDKPGLVSCVKRNCLCHILWPLSCLLPVELMLILIDQNYVKQTLLSNYVSIMIIVGGR